MNSTLRKGTLLIILVAIVAAILVSGHEQQLHAEQPSWEEVRAPLYSVLHHQFRGSNPTLNARQGIWQLDLESNPWHRLAPFFFWCVGDTSDEQYGYGSYLTFMHDRLVFQGARSWIEIDPESGRLVRRYLDPLVGQPPNLTRVSGLAPSFSFDKGPFVSEREGGGSGLREGTYATRSGSLPVWRVNQRANRISSTG
jgi:hypothetical protein